MLIGRRRCLGVRSSVWGLGHRMQALLQPTMNNSLDTFCVVGAFSAAERSSSFARLNRRNRAFAKGSCQQWGLAFRVWKTCGLRISRARACRLWRSGASGFYCVFLVVGALHGQEHDDLPRAVKIWPLSSTNPQVPHPKSPNLICALCLGMPVWMAPEPQ